MELNASIIFQNITKFSKINSVSCFYAANRQKSTAKNEPKIRLVFALLQ